MSGTVDRRGFTLVETMIALAVMALLLLIVGPRIRRGVMRAEVRSARVTVSSLYAQARSVALQTGRPARLVLRNDSAWVVVMYPTAPDTVGSIRDLKADYQVTMTPSTDSVKVDPRGIVTGGATTKVLVVRDDLKDSIVVSGYGRMITR